MDSQIIPMLLLQNGLISPRPSTLMQQIWVVMEEQETIPSIIAYGMKQMDGVPGIMAQSM